MVFSHIGMTYCTHSCTAHHRSDCIRKSTARTVGLRARISHSCGVFGRLTGTMISESIDCSIVLLLSDKNVR